MKKETVFITGGAGFIGSHIADRLIHEGYRVVVIDNLSTGKKNNLSKDAVFYHMDIQDPKLATVFEQERPAFVSHHAAQVGVLHSVMDPLFDAKINVLGSINVLQHCVHYGVKKFIFASSGGALYKEEEARKNIFSRGSGDPSAAADGRFDPPAADLQRVAKSSRKDVFPSFLNHRFPASESHGVDPLSPYGISKATGEHYVRYFHRAHGLPYSILRYANVYGPRQDPFGEAGVIAIFIQKMLNGDQPIIHGDGAQTRDFIYIDDVVEANMLAMKSASSDIFNIGTGIETSVNQIFDDLKALINPEIEKKYGPAKPGEQRRSVIDPTKAQKWLQWFPRVSLEKGLAKTVKYFRESLKNSSVVIPSESASRGIPRGWLRKGIPPLPRTKLRGRSE